jgi:hypothetical protein
MNKKIVDVVHNLFVSIAALALCIGVGLGLQALNRAKVDQIVQGLDLLNSAKLDQIIAQQREILSAIIQFRPQQYYGPMPMPMPIPHWLPWTNYGSPVLTNLIIDGSYTNGPFQATNGVLTNWVTGEYVVKKIQDSRIYQFQSEEKKLYIQGMLETNLSGLLSNPKIHWYPEGISLEN